MKASLVYRWSRNFFRFGVLPLFRFRVEGIENIPEKGGVILASNHQSFLDPVALGCGTPRVPVRFMARDTLFQTRFMGFYLRQTHVFPVRRGGADRSAWKLFEELVRQGEQVTFFPEGTRSEDGRLQQGNPGSGMLIHRCPGATVIPVRIRGTHKVLPRSGGFKGFHRISVRFGKPVDLSDLWAQEGGREVYAQTTERIMAAIAALPLVGGRDDDAP
jgi:1-acyl-sn-glycerol-3-phosphate acyltransferase